jgi:hypothetical protein
MATLFLFRALYSTASHLSFYAFETHDMWEIICSWSVGPNRHWSRLTDEEDFVTAAHVCTMLAVADSSIGALNMQQSTLYVWNRRCAIQSSKFQNSANIALAGLLAFTRTIRPGICLNVPTD